jgi:penicillin-binding protein 1A
MSPSSRSPVAIEKVLDPDGHTRDQDHIRHTRVIPYGVAQTAKGILSQVITSGTGKAAQIAEFAAGKTGTTENYGDAWFVGFNKDLTVAVWVGYPDKLKPMLTEYHGSAVAGGTFPAEIWHDFMTAWIKIRDTRYAARHHGQLPGTTTSTTPLVTPTTATPSTPTAPTPTQATPTPAPTATPTPQTPAQPAPAPQQPAQPAQPAPGAGTGGGTGTGGGAGTPAGTATPGTTATG